jgi:GGDEF domain-containing protein
LSANISAVNMNYWVDPSLHGSATGDCVSCVRLAGLGAAGIMSKLNRAELDHLERRELQLTVLAAVFVLVLAAGLAAFMYPLVFVHPEGNKWTLRVAFFGFCVLTLLFVGYLVDRQRMVGKLKQHLLEELERNVELRHQASVDLLQSMPDINHFWDLLTMEFRRAVATEKTLSLLLVKAMPGQGAGRASVDPDSWGDAAKAISRKLRPTDSIYRLSADLFALVLPETDTANAQRVSLRLQEELQVVRAKFGGSYDINCYNYPEQVHSAHELEDIVRSLLPEQPGWDVPVPLASI